MSVRSLLVTGDEASLWLFHAQVAMTLNAVDRRGHTVHYKCMDEHLPWALDLARVGGVGVQEVVGSGESETYPVLVEGPLWRPS